jgi:hypothetical protein
MAGKQGPDRAVLHAKRRLRFCSFSSPPLKAVPVWGPELLNAPLQAERALAFFERMQRDGVQGNNMTYAALCDVFQKQGKWGKLTAAVQASR